MKFIDIDLLSEENKENRKWLMSFAVSLLSLVIPLVFNLFQYDKKELTYQVLSEITVVDLADSVLQNIEVKYKGQSLKSLDFVTFKLTNSGDLPIRPADYDSPLAISLDQTAEVLRATVVEASPRAMQIEIVESKHGLQIRPMLLNAGDYFVLQLMTQGHRDKIEFHAHIAEVSIVSETASPSKILRGDLSELLQLPPAILVYAALFSSLVFYVIGYRVGKRLMLARMVICWIGSAVFSLLIFPLVFKLQPIIGAISNYAIATTTVAIIWALYTAGTTIALYETLTSKTLSVTVMESKE